MRTQELELFIHPDGRVTREARGVTETEHLDLQALLAGLLGGEVVNTEHTCEFEPDQDQTVGTSLPIRQ